MQEDAGEALRNCTERQEQTVYTRKEAAGILGVTIDTLRNWEIKRPVFRQADGQRLPGL